MAATEEYLSCNTKSHHSYSEHLKDRVPSELFNGIRGGKEILYKTCIDCRTYFRQNMRRYQAKLSTPSDTEEQGFQNCPAKGHDTKSGSSHPRKKVPIELFRKEPADPKSSLLKCCSDCRTCSSLQKKGRLVNLKMKAIANGGFYCTNCHRAKEESERALNKDGTPSILCLSCKEVERARSRQIRENVNDCRLELIFEHESSCQVCQRIFLRPTDGGYIPIVLQTYFEDDNQRYVDYDETMYLARDFLAKFKDRLELRIIQLDHLTETEQRERGLLKPNEPFIPKKRNVSRMSSSKAVKLEALKCQHVCAMCHLDETVRREVGLVDNSRSHSERKKLAYVIQLKNDGCSLCTYKNPDIPRHFDMDHIDPKTKVKEISRMVKDNSYTMEQLVEECKKCRVLCKHCHIIHTSKQIRDKK